MRNRIREWRVRRDLTLEALADRVGTTAQQISRLERSERGLTDDWLARLAVVLEVAKADLLLETGTSPPDGKFAKDAEEQRILAGWRALNESERAIFIRLLEGLSGGR